MRADPKPYRRRAFTRFWSRHWNVEFWDAGDHGFRPFWTHRGAVSWARKQNGVR